MRFNFLVVLIGFLLAGCGLRTGEPSYEIPVVKVEQEFSCLGEVGEKFDEYFEGKFKGKELDEFFDCAQKAFKQFKDFARGEGGDYHTPEELRSFLHRNFLKENTISDKLLVEALRIKKVMVGGEIDQISEQDLERGIELLEIVRKKANLLQPYILTLTKALEYEDINEEHLDASIVALKQAAKHFGMILKHNQHSYDFDSFESFLIEFRRFLKWDEGGDSKGSDESEDLKIRRWVELFHSMKGLMADGDDGVILPEDWEFYLMNGAQWYSSYLQFQYQVKTTRIFSAKGLNYFNEFVDAIIESVESVLLNRERRQVEYSEMNKAFYALESLDLIPFGITASTLSRIFPEIVRRGFSQIDRPIEDRKAESFHLRNFKHIRYEYELWSEVQHFLQDNKQSDGEILVPGDVLSHNYFECINSTAPKRYVDPRCEFVRIMYQRPMFNQNFKSTYLTNSDRSNWISEFSNLSRLNAVRVTVRMLIFSFGDIQNHGDYLRIMNQQGIKKEEFETFYRVSKELGVDLKLMHPMGENVGNRSFQEAKMFTYSARGLIPNDPDDIVTYPELMEFISIVYSGGVLGRASFDLLVGKCGATGRPGALGYETIRFDCFKKEFMSVYETQLGSLPGMQKYVKEMTPEQKVEFQHSLFNIMYDPKYDYRYIEYSDFTSMLTLTLYIEAIMTRYDQAPYDGVLDYDELSLAYYTFQGLFLNMTDNNPAIAELAFYYTIRDAAVPSLCNLGFTAHIASEILPWRDGMELSEDFKEELKTDRLKLFQVFEIVGKALKALVSEDKKGLPASEFNSICN
ncbi:MAG: hypothetical protein CL677_00735 [Bdellovibrionaceae bacterium]|nr:hypothetical protein [Pseudobdellovibrionaceae bacterium]|tara:strand:- start:72024 stop:74426 length:2403 start_codon:yes stop_codon:yes gene_type:complete